MKMPLYQLDSFTRRRFSGNPAAVVVLERFVEDATLQDIAAENNLAETAFLEPAGAEAWNLRWFTPTLEVALCGHATLASAWVVFEALRWPHPEVVFHTRRSGALTVRRTGDGYLMDFPSLPSVPAPAPAAAEVTRALGMAAQDIQEILLNADNYLVVLASPPLVRELCPDLAAVARLDRLGLIATAAGAAESQPGPYDCVSRYFAPAKGIPEDPVTGGAHCALTPYWAARLGKSELWAYQASARGGELRCRLRGQRVDLEGSCVPYLRGEIEVAQG